MDIDKGGRLALLIIVGVIAAIIVAGLVHVATHDNGGVNTQPHYYQWGYRVGTSPAADRLKLNTRLIYGQGDVKAVHGDCSDLAVKSVEGPDLAPRQLHQWIAGCVAGLTHIDHGAETREHPTY